MNIRVLGCHRLFGFCGINIVSTCIAGNGFHPFAAVLLLLCVVDNDAHLSYCGIRSIDDSLSLGGLHQVAEEYIYIYIYIYRERER